MAQPLPELTNVLVSAQSPDAAVRQQAEQALEHLKSSQPAAYLAALAAELGGEQKPAEARQIAGLILKNALDAPSAVQKVRNGVKTGKERKAVER
jgi:importin subunit beta-1